MIWLERSIDYELIRQILTDPEIYDDMGDDFVPLASEFQVNQHPGIVYLAVLDEGLRIGLMCLFPANPICWELHIAMLPWATRQQKREAARLLVPWLEDHTQCRRITAAIPACNKRAIVYGTHFLGMERAGRQAGAFQKNGSLWDLVILGRSIGRDCAPGLRLSTARTAYAEKRTAEINSGAKY